MDQFFGSLLFSLLVLALVAGAWTWLLVLYKKGIRALLGFDRVVVQEFENVLIYRDGRFERSLTPGSHWIRMGSLQLVRVDMRPKSFGLRKARSPRIILRSTFFMQHELRSSIQGLLSKALRFIGTKYRSDCNPW